MSQQNLDYVRSRLEVEAEKLAGFSTKGQQLRKIRFREALKVIIDNDLMLTRARIEKSWQKATERLEADGYRLELPSEVFKRVFFEEISR